MTATTATATLNLDALARLNDAALEVILRHGTASPSIEVELGLWQALSKAYRGERRIAKWLTRGRSPSQQEVLSALASATLGVAIDAGANADDLHEIELDLLFAFGLIDVNKGARAVLAA